MPSIRIGVLVRGSGAWPRPRCRHRGSRLPCLAKALLVAGCPLTLAICSRLARAQRPLRGVNPSAWLELSETPSMHVAAAIRLLPRGSSSDQAYSEGGPAERQAIGLGSLGRVAAIECRHRILVGARSGGRNRSRGVAIYHAGPESRHPPLRRVQAQQVNVRLGWKAHAGSLTSVTCWTVRL